jgi:nucleoside-diphosphate-sugar epimerase
MLQKKNNRILIVGGAGYIGSVLTKYLLKKNHKINVLDNLLYSNYFSIKLHQKNKNFKFIKGNFNNLIKLKKSLKNVSCVIFLAGLVGDPISKKYPKKSRLINYYYIKKYFQRLNEFKINKLIFISSCSNYGLLTSNKLAKESSELKPLSYYAKDKVRVENFLIKNKKKFNFSTVILRFATAFGNSPRMRFDLTINEFVRELYFKKVLRVYDPLTWRPYCHVKDFSMIIKKIIEKNFNSKLFSIYNCGNNKNNFTKKDIIDKILKYLPKSQINYINSSGKDKRNYKVDFSKLEKELKVKTEYTVDDGIKEIISALKKNKYNKKKNLYGNFKIA